jgi:hypothetical protein
MWSLTQSSVSWLTASQSPCNEYYRYTVIITLTDSECACTACRNNVHVLPAWTMCMYCLQEQCYSFTVKSHFMLWCEGGWSRIELQVQSNVNWMFLELTFALMLLLVLLQTFTLKMSTFPWIHIVLPTQLLNYTFILSTNWQVAVISSTYNCGKEQKRLFSVIISHFLCYLHVTNCVQCSKTWLSYPHWSALTTWQWRSDQC